MHLSASKKWMIGIISAIVLAAGCALWFNRGNSRVPAPSVDVTYDDSTKNIVFGDSLYHMVLVEAGTFTMGATPEQEDPDEDEKPVHSVTLTDDYYIGETEVTQKLWQAVMGSVPSYIKGTTRPVECVSWDDCQRFIKKLNKLTGQTFRLPTEAEWEFAARGGNKSKGYRYSGSDRLDDVAWYDGNSGNEPQPVKSKAANELGIYDMSGNVMEWCQDREGDYGNGSQTNPTGPNSGSDRVCRGGSWNYNARLCRSSYRGSNTPDCSNSHLGLRLVLVP